MLESFIRSSISESKRKTWFKEKATKNDRFQKLTQKQKNGIFNHLSKHVEWFQMSVIIFFSLQFCWFYHISWYYWLNVMIRRYGGWVKNSFHNCLWVSIIDSGQKRWCYLANIQTKICCWHFCVTHISSQESNIILRFSYFELKVVKQYWAWWLLSSINPAQEFWIFLQVHLSFPATVFRRLFNRATKTFKGSSSTLVTFSIKWIIDHFHVVWFKNPWARGLSIVFLMKFVLNWFGLIINSHQNSGNILRNQKTGKTYSTLRIERDYNMESQLKQ